MSRSRPTHTPSSPRRLANPVAADPLEIAAKGAKTACILICDFTRPVPNRLFLRPLIDRLTGAGVPLGGITVLVATGLHRPNLGDELADLVGDPWVLENVAVVNHYARNDADHVMLGETPTRGVPVGIDRRFMEADIRIATGLVEPHFMAGWSGGRKVVAPGIAHHTTIRTFHSARFMEDPLATSCNLDGNPLHEEQLEILRMIGGRIYGLNTVLDEERALIFASFGEIVASHAAAVDFVRDSIAVKVPRKFRTVVTSAAGYPLDRTYYQTVKGMVTPIDILEDGGTLVIVSECGEGIGSDEFRVSAGTLRRDGRRRVPRHAQRQDAGRCRRMADRDAAQAAPDRPHRPRGARSRGGRPRGHRRDLPRRSRLGTRRGAGRNRGPRYRRDPRRPLRRAFPRGGVSVPRHLHLDPVGGVAGDMFAAAMLDAFPEFETAALALVAEVTGGAARASLDRAPKGGFAGAHLVIEAEHEHAHRHLSDVRAMLEGCAALPPAATAIAVDIFTRLAEAEAQVHGTSVEAVRFHEVGALDSIADIALAGFLIDAAGAASWSCGPLPLGGGTVRTAHGMMPVPAPATARLMEGFETVDDGLAGERVTPTGAAILAHLRPRIVPRRPSAILAGSGTGFGTRILPDRPNALRVLVLEGASPNLGRGRGDPLRDRRPERGGPRHRP